MNLFTKYRLTDLLENEFMVATVVGGGALVPQGSESRRGSWYVKIHQLHHHHFNKTIMCPSLFSIIWNLVHALCSCGCPRSHGVTPAQLAKFPGQFSCLWFPFL